MDQKVESVKVGVQTAMRRCGVQLSEKNLAWSELAATKLVYGTIGHGVDRYNDWVEALKALPEAGSGNIEELSSRQTYADILSSSNF